MTVNDSFINLGWSDHVVMLFFLWWWQEDPEEKADANVFAVVICIAMK